MTQPDKPEAGQREITIHGAFFEAQKKFTPPVRNAKNDHFKTDYADLKADIDAVKPALHQNNIYLSQPFVSDEIGMAVVTILHHVPSGTQMECRIPLLLGKQGMQDIKSASTYARRIGLENLTGIASADDDAETAQSGNTFGAALSDAWRQAVEDNLPEGATPLQRATAFADAICDDFKGKGVKALQNRWNKHKRMIEQMEGRFPDLHGKVVDAYENAMMEADGTQTRGPHEDAA